MANPEPATVSPLVLGEAYGAGQLTNATLGGHGGFGFTICDAPPGVVVEASTDLAHWIPIATNVATGARSWTFADSSSTNFVHRFYRTVTQP